MAEVFSFPELTPEQALARIRQLSERSGNIGLSPHTRKRMTQRLVSWPQIAHVLRHGLPAEGPYQDLFGNWVCQLSARTAGRHVDVVVKMKSGRRLIIRTVMV